MRALPSAPSVSAALIGLSLACATGASGSTERGAGHARDPRDIPHLARARWRGRPAADAPAPGPHRGPGDPRCRRRCPHARRGEAERRGARARPTPGTRGSTRTSRTSSPRRTSRSRTSRRRSRPAPRKGTRPFVFNAPPEAVAALQRAGVDRLLREQPRVRSGAPGVRGDDPAPRRAAHALRRRRPVRARRRPRHGRSGGPADRVPGVRALLQPGWRRVSVGAALPAGVAARPRAPRSRPSGGPPRRATRWSSRCTGGTSTRRSRARMSTSPIGSPTRARSWCSGTTARAATDGALPARRCAARR